MMDDKLQFPNTPAFFESVAQIIEKARSFVGRTADLAMCVTYFEVGRMIVEEEQGGKKRAKYGKGLLTGLSAYLNERIGKGYSETTLKYARKFYQVYAPSIRQAMPDVLRDREEILIRQTMLDELDRYVKTDDERPTVGILLCREKDDAIVELTLPEDANIYASEYNLYLPGKALLQSKLTEWIEEFEEVQALREITIGDDSLSLKEETL
jgi:hypothetical protein